jgi:hypothetical protein
VDGTVKDGKVDLTVEKTVWKGYCIADDFIVDAECESFDLEGNKTDEKTQISFMPRN